MKAVVLIGGKGTRLAPITRTVPKAMVPLRGKPYIRYMVESLKAAGLDGAVFSMGYLPGPIEEYFAGEALDGFSLEYVVEDRPLGTAGGIKNTEARLGRGPFVATNGDVLTGLDLTEVINAHIGSGALATITLTAVEDPTRYGLVEVDHEMRVKKFIEKPGADEVRTSLINAGIYVLEREVLEMIPEGREVSIEREIFPELRAMGKLKAYVSSSYWRDIGTPRSYLGASHDVLSGTIGRNGSFRYASVDDAARVSKNVALLPPLFVDEGCEIGAGATVGGRTALGKRCVIGEGAMVEGSILMDGAKIGAEAVVRNSIIGPMAEVRDGTIVRGMSALGAGCVVEEENVLDGGIRVNPATRLARGTISF